MKAEFLDETGNQIPVSFEKGRLTTRLFARFRRLLA